MTKRTIDVIITVATEIFKWVITLLKEKSDEKEDNNDGERTSKKK